MMRQELTQLLEELGADGYELLIHTQYHVQIRCSKGKHDIWFTREGDIKFQPAGQRKWHFTNPTRLKEELKKYDYVKTDLGMMEVITFIRKVPIKEGIFVDAGWKEGKGRIAVICIRNGDIDVHVRHVTCSSPLEAEDMGIKLAIQMFPGDDPIFNDSTHAVERNAPRAKWLSREQNKEADALSNLRKNP